jgi:2,3-bisphosphoglycerate-dependent phosphoglycerate mutase
MIQSKQLYFVRHGESEANLLRQFSNRGRKHPLTERGRKQAEQLADALCTELITHIYTSPLLRATETALILATTLGVSVTVHDALREYDCGILEGRADAAGWALYTEVQEAWLAHGDWDRRVEGGESFWDMQARFVPFVLDLVERQRQGEAYVLIGHGGLFHCMLPLVLANVDSSFVRSHPMDNTAYVLAAEQGGHLICTQWCGLNLPIFDQDKSENETKDAEI